MNDHSYGHLRPTLDPASEAKVQRSIKKFHKWAEPFTAILAPEGRASRRRLMYGLAGAAAALFGLGDARRAAASHLPPGDPCTATEDCSQAEGVTVCADNGVASDGALNCCRTEGGACADGAGCCGNLLCADNGIASDGEYNCCRNEGGACTSGAACCGSLLCVGGVCSVGGTHRLGQSCTSTSQCSQSGGAVTCADNGIPGDGASNCCRTEGGACTRRAHCCGSLHCARGVCRATAS